MLKSPQFSDPLNSVLHSCGTKLLLSGNGGIWLPECLQQMKQINYIFLRYFLQNMECPSEVPGTATEERNCGMNLKGMEVHGENVVEINPISLLFLAEEYYEDRNL